MAKQRKRILLAVDGSDQAFEAVRYASRLFLPDRLEVVLLHVMTPLHENFWDIEHGSSDKQKADATGGIESEKNIEIQAFMKKARHQFLDRNVPDDAITIKIRERKTGIARDIGSESKDGYDGVVVGRWGMSLLRDFLWGSIANKLMESLTHVPLCVVGGSPRIGNILLAVDASEGARKAVDYIAKMINGKGWEITLFHAAGSLDGEEMQKAELLMAPVFEDLCNHLEKAGVNPKRITTKTVAGVTSRAGAIIEEALKGGHGTVVVGRRGLSDVEAFAMGSVSNKVIHMAKKEAVWVVS